jgi:hypothetical protein
MSRRRSIATACVALVIVFTLPVACSVKSGAPPTGGGLTGDSGGAAFDASEDQATESGDAASESTDSRADVLDAPVGADVTADVTEAASDGPADVAQETAPEASDKCTGVVCMPLDGCHTAGTCNPADGTCSTPAAPDGAA